MLYNEFAQFSTFHVLEHENNEESINKEMNDSRVINSIMNRIKGKGT